MLNPAEKRMTAEEKVDIEALTQLADGYCIVLEDCMAGQEFDTGGHVKSQVVPGLAAYLKDHLLFGIEGGFIKNKEEMSAYAKNVLSPVGKSIIAAIEEACK